MFEITAIDVGMCLPKCFVIMVNSFTFLLGSVIFGSSIFGMTLIESTLGRDSLNFLFYAPIAFGAIILFISFFGCCGACFKNRCMLMTFAILLLIVFACQVGVVYFVFDLVAKINSSVNEFLLEQLKSAKDEPEDVRVKYHIWTVIQYFFECCGVTALSDWQTAPDESLPMSCCPTRNETVVDTMEMSQNVTCSQVDAFPTGCKSLITDKIDMLFHPVTVGVTVVLVIQLINLILACCMFFVYGWTNKRNVKSFSVTSGKISNDHFVIKEKY